MLGVEKKIERAKLPYRRPIIDVRFKRHDSLRGEMLSRDVVERRP
jgi:hypothetical protein